MAKISTFFINLPPDRQANEMDAVQSHVSAWPYMTLCPASNPTRCSTRWRSA